MNINSNPLIIAHRGESHQAPENTMAAINLAWKNGAVAVEIDVRLTLDDKIVVIHDDDTKRLGDRNLKVAESELNELKKVDVGAYKGTEWKGEGIPTLSEVLNTVPLNGKLIIEIKCGLEIVPVLASLVHKSQLNHEQIELISFNYKVLGAVKAELSEHKALWLLDLDYYWPAWILVINKKKILRKITQSKLNGINVWAGKYINQKFVAFFKSKGLGFYTWTVNDANRAQELVEMGVDAITSDRAEWMSKQIKLK